MGTRRKAVKNRYYLHIEVMRIVAAYFVIFNHTGKEGFLLFSTVPAGGAGFWASLLLSVFCKFAVPMFLGISGALLLSEPDEPLAAIWNRRMRRIAVTLLVYSLLYYIVEIVRSDDRFEVRRFVKALYTANIKGHLWYLYLFIAYLAVLPFLRALVRNLNDRYFIYMIAIAMFFGGILPAAEFLILQGNTTASRYIRITWLTDYAVLYPCLGYFMQNRISVKWIRKYLPWVWAVNIAGLAASCGLTYLRLMVDDRNLQLFHNSFVVINFIAMSLTIRLIYDGRVLGKIRTALISSVGRCSYGIYLWHIFVKELPPVAGIPGTLASVGIDPMVSVLVMCLVVMAISYMITLIQSRIPVLKRLVGF